MARPKLSKDKQKRKSKTLLNSKDERNIINEYEGGKSLKYLRLKYNVSNSYLIAMLRLRNVKPKIDWSVIKLWRTIDDASQLNQNISGIYAIYFFNKKNSNDIWLYIGSSTNISTRLNDHLISLKNNRHFSKKLTTKFNDHNYMMRCCIIEQCEPKRIMQKEGDYLAKWSKSCLLNSFFPTKAQDLEPWLEEAIKRKSYCEQYKINELTGCKESLSVRKDGYGAIKIVVPNRGKKYLLKHRVAYWAKTGQYPELVRHICDNPKCYNEDHLVAGNHRDNALDKRKGFAEDFELKWLEYGADLLKLNDYYSGKWKGNMKLAGSNVSTALYSWEKKLGLREKYPEIMRNNKDRRANKIV